MSLILAGSNNSGSAPAFYGAKPADIVMNAPPRYAASAPPTQTMSAFPFASAVLRQPTPPRSSLASSLQYNPASASSSVGAAAAASAATATVKPHPQSCCGRVRACVKKCLTNTCDCLAYTCAGNSRNSNNLNNSNMRAQLGAYEFEAGKNSNNKGLEVAGASDMGCLPCYCCCPQAVDRQAQDQNAYQAAWYKCDWKGMKNAESDSWKNAGDVCKTGCTSIGKCCCCTAKFFKDGASCCVSNSWKGCKIGFKGIGKCAAGCWDIAKLCGSCASEALRCIGENCNTKCVGDVAGCLAGCCGDILEGLSKVDCSDCKK